MNLQFVYPIHPTTEKAGKSLFIHLKYGCGAEEQRDKNLCFKLQLALALSIIQEYQPLSPHLGQKAKLHQKTAVNMHKAPQTQK